MNISHITEMHGYPIVPGSLKIIREQDVVIDYDDLDNLWKMFVDQFLDDLFPCSTTE